MKRGDTIPELKVTPDAGLTQRYKDASGDPNLIHVDEEFAKSVGLPGVILHGLYTMAQVARPIPRPWAATRADSSASRCSSAAWASRSRRSRSAGRSRRSATGTSSSTRSPSRAEARSIRNAEAELEQ